ncbi:aldo/keto reductase [Vagococcus martis]|uniref:Aldo/keto reductase n=1 Tax=Vagococcus martis TaxID=1768210 RepID=A0A1V4DK46_9ENTE|nr:aldo/keto reductase [Vagococcus martis]OPF88580.1 aldo/keto reductase [Vagococcus martis]
MKLLQIGTSNIMASQLALGCMRMAGLSKERAKEVIETSLESGINFFDHADIYGDGESEVIFSKAIKEIDVKRDDIFIQSKCGIRKGFYDFSKEHIIQSVEGSLTRLGTDYLDVLALHRPDALMEPEEVSEAFYQLKKAGKVRYFGVSNFAPTTVELLQQSLSDKLIVNQLQFGLQHASMVTSQMNVNMENELGINRDGAVLDHMRLKQMTVQAWSPYQFGYFDGVFIDHPDFKELNECLNKLANSYSVTSTGIATAWINRHPANIQTIIGSMNPSRIRDITQASDIRLTREEWYELYQASGFTLL